MAGFVAAGLLRDDHPQVDVEGASRPGNLVVDVRTPEEYRNGHVPGAINIPLETLRARLHELPKDRDIVVYCQVGQRGYLATRILRQAGYAAANLGGGYKGYQMVHEVSL
ncbi:MAG: rhodanese-like domain-containing protein [Gemmataceae bacterium]